MSDAVAPPASSSRSLFRRAVMQGQKPQLMGQVIVNSTWFYKAASLAALALAAGLVLFVAEGSYTRRTAVSGQLVPSAGLVRVLPPQVGVVLEKHVKDGQSVQKGDLLYVLNVDRLGLGLVDVQAQLSQQIGLRQQSLERELLLNRRTEQEEINHLERRRASLEADGKVVKQQLEQQRLRIAAAEELAQRYQGLAEKGYVSKEQALLKDTELSEQRTRWQTLQRDALTNQRDFAQVARDIDGARARTASLSQQLQRSMASTQQELTESESRRRLAVTAPEAGSVTLVVAELGQAADPTRPMLTIVPVGTVLEAKVFAPSRAIGFVRLGQEVLLRYQAFPYQKFGHATGKVKAVSNAAATPQELAAGGYAEAAANEPMFAITVQLDAQTIQTFGQSTTLQTGMRFDADILQERRKLYEWLLEPLFSIQGRMQS